MKKKYILIPRVWRSEFFSIIFFMIASVASIYLSEHFPNTLINQKVMLSDNWGLDINFPLLWLIPFFTFLVMVTRIYNVRYSLNATGVEAIEGRISLWQKSALIKYEDIRGIATRQSLFDRILDIGCVTIGTAATGRVEILLEGIASPSEVQDLIRRERDARNKKMIHDVDDDK